MALRNLAAMARYTLSKNERLSRRNDIRRLMVGGNSGNHFFDFPLKLVYRFRQPGLEAHSRVMFMAGKRRFKRAVDRNRAKRLMREGYRMQRPGLDAWLQEHSLAVDIGIIYVGKKPTDQSVVSGKILALLNRFYRECKMPE